MTDWPALIRFVLIALGVYELSVFVGLSLLGVYFETRGDHRRVRQLRELVVRLPSVFGERARAEWRQGLVWSYLQEGRYKEAAELCRQLLAKKPKPADEARQRLLLSDCLDGLGQQAEAEAEQRRAEQVLAGAQLDAGFYMTRGSFLDKQRKYALSCEAYCKALPLIPEWDTFHKAQALLQLGLASYNAGRPSDAIRYAEEAIPLKPPKQFLIVAHSVVALGYSGVANLDAAEVHRRRGYELARETGNKHLTGELLAQLADLEMKHGRLAESIRHCEEAAALHPAAGRLAHLTRAESLRVMGRFVEAREAFEASRTAQPNPQPDLERRGQATIDLGLSWLEAEEGNFQLAVEYLERALPEMAGDDKLALWCTAAQAWYYAASGRTEEAQRKMWEVQTQAPAFSADRQTQSLCRAMVARACYGLGDLARCREHWEAYFQTYPDPVFRPNGLYHYGECLLRSGDRENALVAWQQAVAMDLDTHHSRLAARRIAELQSPGMPAA